jgi:septin family protein
MVYVDGILIFKKGEVEIKEGLHTFYPFEVICKANFIAEYCDSNIQILKNRWSLADCNWKAIGDAIKLNESLKNKR